MKNKSNLKSALWTGGVIAVLGIIAFTCVRRPAIAKAKAGDWVLYRGTGTGVPAQLRCEVVACDSTSVKVRVKETPQYGSPSESTETFPTVMFWSSEQDFAHGLGIGKGDMQPRGEESIQKAGRTFLAKKFEMRFEKHGQVFKGWAWLDPEFPFEIIKIELSNGRETARLDLDKFQLASVE